MEYTKEIEGTRYKVSMNGDIHGPRGKILKPKLTKTGYHEIQIYLGKNTSKWFRVHRVVAQAFIPNPENKPFVNHKDGNKMNNDVSNLEWVTHRENMDHAIIHNLVHKGENNTRSIHTNAQIEEVCKLLELGYRDCDIADSLGMHKYNVSLIRAGMVWLHISCKYNIPKRSRSMSDETIHWICSKIKEGLTQGQIIALANNKRITKTMIKDIRRRKIYRDISKQYF